MVGSYVLDQLGVVVVMLLVINVFDMDIYILNHLIKHTYIIEK